VRIIRGDCEVKGAESRCKVHFHIRCRGVDSEVQSRCRVGPEQVQSSRCRGAEIQKRCRSGAELQVQSIVCKMQVYKCMCRSAEVQRWVHIWMC